MIKSYTDQEAKVAWEVAIDLSLSVIPVMNSVTDPSVDKFLNQVMNVVMNYAKLVPPAFVKPDDGEGHKRVGNVLFEVASSLGKARGQASNSIQFQGTCLTLQKLVDRMFEIGRDGVSTIDM